MGQKPRRPRGQGTRLPDGRWQVRLRLPDGRVKAFYGKTLREAQKKRNDARRLIEQGRPLPNERITLADYLHRWLEQVVRPNLRATVYHRYVINVEKHILPTLGNRRIAALQPSDFQALYATKQAENLAPRTIRQIHATARNALNVAVSWGLIPRNPAIGAVPPTAPDDDYETLSPDDAMRMLAAVHGTSLDCIVTLALTTGMRQGELLGLKWEDVDLEDGMIRVRRQVQRVPGEGWQETAPKSRKGIRSIRLTQIGVAALRRQRERIAMMRNTASSTWTDADLVHPNHAGRPIERQNLLRQWKRFLANNGFDPTFHFHNLRHSTATLLFRLGVPMKVVQQILGHSTISVTSDIYTSPVMEMQDVAMAALESLLSDEHQNKHRRQRLTHGV